MKPTASPRGCSSVVPIKDAEETRRSNFFYEAARKVRTGPELEPHESTKRTTRACFAALGANIEAPDTTLDPFRTASKLDFSHLRRVASRIGKRSSKARRTFSLSVSAKDPHKKSSAFHSLLYVSANASGRKSYASHLVACHSAARHIRDPRAPFAGGPKRLFFSRIVLTSVPYPLPING
jgi:hypothetical protein